MPKAAEGSGDSGGGGRTSSGKVAPAPPQGETRRSATKIVRKSVDLTQATTYNRQQKSLDERLLDGSLSRTRRAGVSAEVAGPSSTTKRRVRSPSLDSRLKSTETTKDVPTRDMLRKAIDSCILFGGMNDTQRGVIIDMMVGVKCRRSEVSDARSHRYHHQPRALSSPFHPAVCGAVRSQVIINQGEMLTGGSSDNFYVVGEGYFEIHRRKDAESEEELVQERGVGDTFGELALMYNVPRQATVTCVSEQATLWALQRQVFQEITHLDALDSIQSIVETLQQVNVTSPWPSP